MKGCRGGKGRDDRMRNKMQAGVEAEAGETAAERDKGTSKVLTVNFIPNRG